MFVNPLDMLLLGLPMRNLFDFLPGLFRHTMYLRRGLIWVGLAGVKLITAVLFSEPI